MESDDNLIEARLRQLQPRTPPQAATPGEAEPFWPAPVVTMPAPQTNRWFGPLVGVLVGIGLTQMMAAFGGRERPIPRPTVHNVAVTPDPTTTALAKLIAAPAATASAAREPERAINRNEYKELLARHNQATGRPDPFAEIDVTPPAPLPPTVSVDQVIVPEPPPAPTATPQALTTVRFSGSLAGGEGYLALVEETTNGQASPHRWRVGDRVLGSYLVAEITLKAVKLRWGGETHWLALGNATSLPRREGESPSGLSALAPEPAAPRARRADWQAPKTPVPPPALQPAAPPSVRLAPVISTPEPPVAEAPLPEVEPRPDEASEQAETGAIVQ